jgi:hypothetical protein
MINRLSFTCLIDAFSTDALDHNADPLPSHNALTLAWYNYSGIVLSGETLRSAIQQSAHGLPMNALSAPPFGGQHH